MPLQGRCRAIADNMQNGTRNVIGHMTTDLSTERETHKKNLTHMLFCSRFDEVCTTIEDEDCDIVTDQVWENKCEMVNVTVPQKECAEVPGSMRMESK